MILFWFSSRHKKKEVRSSEASENSSQFAFLPLMLLNLEFAKASVNTVTQNGCVRLFFCARETSKACENITHQTCDLNLWWQVVRLSLEEGTPKFFPSFLILFCILNVFLLLYFFMQLWGSNTLETLDSSVDVKMPNCQNSFVFVEVFYVLEVFLQKCFYHSHHTTSHANSVKLLNDTFLSSPPPSNTVALPAFPHFHLNRDSFYLSCNVRVDPHSSSSPPVS